MRENRPRHKNREADRQHNKKRSVGSGGVGRGTRRAKGQKVITEPKYNYIIGIGNTSDWEAGRGSLYYIEGRDGKKYLPLFTTPEKVQGFIEANFNQPMAHMSMLESVGLSHARPLTKGRVIIMPVDDKGVARAALIMDADYLVRDPRPGRHQEVMRLPKEDA